MKSKVDINNEKSSIFYDDFNIINELRVKDGDNLSAKNAILLAQNAEKSVCKIIKNNGYGSGFFCKIKYEDNQLCCLFTNNHVIDNEMISKNENIEIKLNNKNYNISLKLNRRIWTDNNLDFTSIEVIQEDNIIEKIKKFELDINIYNIDFELKTYHGRGIALA